MKEPELEIVLRLRPPAPARGKARKAPRCGGCRATIVSRSGLIGARGDQVLCADCLLEQSPRLGWAWRLAETGTVAVGIRAGGWPRTARSRHLSLLLEVLERTRAAVGPIETENHKVALALELLDVIGRHGRGR